VVGAAVLALVGLVVWPAPGGEVADDADDAPTLELSVATWLPRGSLAQDTTVLRAAVSAWRSAASEGIALAPGASVEPLYAGEPDGVRVALLRSRAEQGRLLVAAAVERDGGWRVADAAAVESEVAWLVLPGGDQPRVLAAPGVSAATSLFLRRADALWTRVAIRDDGVTAMLRSLDDPIPVLGVVGRVGGARGLVDVATLTRTSVLPSDPPVEVSSPRWGRSAAVSPEEIDSAIYAEPALPASTGRLAVVAAARVPGGRAVLVESESGDDGYYQYSLVVPGPGGAPRLGAPPIVDGRLAAAVVERDGGRVMVLAASAPSVSRVEVRLPDGSSVIDGIGPTTVVLPPPVPDQVTVLGKRTNGSVVTSLVVPIARLLDAPPG